ncbi:MAG: GAF domain-containing protein [Chloroflexi bacterium]|nr:GAF domain-containing protein [Chloroflexota bacterium]
MALVLMMLVGGVIVYLWLFAWARERRRLAPALDVEQALQQPVPAAENPNEAVLIAREHGQIVFANDAARRWIGLNGSEPNLELIAEKAQPIDSFLDLFAHERQAAFQLAGRWVEGVSHRVPVGSEMRTVVVLRELAASAHSPESFDLSKAMDVINEIGDTINASLGLEQVLQALLSIVNKVIPADVGEIALWNEQRQELVQQGWIGETSYLLQLAEVGSTYRSGEGISGWVAKHRRPLLVEDRRDPSAVQPKLAGNPYQSFVAVPLIVGTRFLGTITFMGLRPGQLRQGDLALLQAIATPLATSIHNADLYLQQTRRISDISTLQAVADEYQLENLDNATQIYAALTERIARLMNAAICGVYIYDEQRQALLPEQPFYGLPPHLVSNLVINLPPNSLQRDIWETKDYWVSNDLRDEPLVQGTNFQVLVNAATIHNIALIPMGMAGRRFGMIQLSNKRGDGGFLPQNIDHLRVLVAQAAIVVENIRLLKREQRIDAELAGLQKITQAIGSIDTQGEVFAEINAHIANLMGVSMCGVLLYDDHSQHLVAQPPFFGVDSSLIEAYRINVRGGTVMGDIWNDEQFWYTNQVSSNLLVFEAGLAEIAEATGVQKTLIAVLTAGGRRLGAVQVSNKLNASDFNDNDARLLMIFAAQVAAMIDNTRLYIEIRRSADTADGLRRVAEMAGGIVTPEEPFTPVLAEISRLLRSPMVYINVLDQQTGGLIVYPRWVYGADIDEPVMHQLSDSQFGFTPAVSHRPLMVNDFSSDKYAQQIYHNIALKMGIKSAIVVPLVIGERSLGELGIANRSNPPYSKEDQATLTTVAAQVSAAIDRLRLYEATGQNLNRRLEELDAISNVSNVLTQTIEMDVVLDTIRKEAERATNADGSTVVLLFPPQRWSDPDVPEMARRIGGDASMDKLADIEKAAVIRGVNTSMVTDYARQKMNPSPRDSRSAIAAPFQYGEQVVGVVHLYHYEANHFDDRAAAFLMTLAAKAALAYANDVRYQNQLENQSRLRQRVEQLSTIFEFSQMLQTQTDTISHLEAMAFSLQRSVGFEVVVMLLVDEDGQVYRRVAQAGMPLPAFDASRKYTITQEQIDALLKPQYRLLDESYFFKIREVTQWYVDGVEALETSYEGIRTLIVFNEEDWHDGDKFIVEIRGATGNRLGLICLDRPLNGKRPDRAVAEVLEIFAHQAASTIENTRLYLESVRAGEQAAQLNEILEAISGTLDINDIVLAVARGALRLLPFSRMTFALLDTEQQAFDVSKVSVKLDNTLEITSERRVDLERTALGHTFNVGMDVLYYAGDSKQPDFADLRGWQSKGEKTSLLLPLITGGVCLGAAHFGADLAQAYGFDEFRPLLKRMINLAATAMQNARLFGQAVNLRSQNESVIESIQQGIVVVDNSGRILSVNEHMRDLFDWDDSAIRRDLFSYSPQLGFLKDDVRKVLEQGEPQSQHRKPTADLKGNQFIRNYYVYPLRSADSIRGAVILVEDLTDRARLERDIETRANQLAALTEISSRITASLDRDEVISLALEEIEKVIKYDTMTLWRRNGAYMVLEGIRGVDDDRVRPEEMRIRIAENVRMNMVVEQQKVVSVNRGSTSILTEPLPGEGDARSWMGVPLVNQGHVVGMFILHKREADFYDDQAAQAAITFANQVAIALSNADLFEQTFARTNELGMLLEAAQATSLTLDIDEVFKTVTDLMLNQLDMDDCAIMTWDKINDELEVQIDVNRSDAPDKVVPRGARFPLSKYPAKRFALHEKQVVVIRHDDESADSKELEELKRNKGINRLLVPLVVRDEARGLIQVEQQTAERTLQQQTVRLARALGSQVAVAIENARLSAETAERFEELFVINELSRAISSTLNLDDVIKIVRDRVPALVNVDDMYLALYDDESQEITFPLVVREGKDINLPPRHLGTDETSYIIRKRQMLILVEDMLSLEDIRRNIGVVNGEGDIKSYMGVPLVSGEQSLGVLAVRAQKQRAFGVNDQGVLTTVAAQLSAAIQNARLYEQINNFAADLNRLVEARTRELEQERDRIDTLYQITSELARTLDMDRVLERALGMVAKAVGADDGVILLLDPMTDQLYSRAVLNLDSLIDVGRADRPVHPAEAIGAWLIENDRELVMDDLHSSDFWNSKQPGAEHWRSALAVVLETGEDVQGVIVFLSEKVAAFAEPQLKLVVSAANQVAAAINNADLYQLIRDQAERLGSLLRSEQEEAQKSQAILEGIADGVMLTDANGLVILFNSAAERILELPRDQVLGQPLAMLTGLYSSSSNIWARSMEDWSSHPERLTAGQYIDERLSLGDRVVSVHLSPVYISGSQGQQFLGTVSVFRDITKEVEVDRIKSEFIANVSHEFRTPMTSIKGFADLLLMGAVGDMEEAQKRSLKIIKDNADRLSSLVNDVLEISKIDAKRDELTVEQIDVQEVIGQVVDNLQEKMDARGKQLQVQVNIAPDLPAFEADSEKLMRILMNLVDNAFNYTYAGGLIDITLERQGERVLLSVRDTGIGIPEEFQPRVWRRFERYEQHALVMDVAGTGLGLSIVKELVELHHGQIWFESQLNKGTTFFVSLPLQQPGFVASKAS